MQELKIVEKNEKGQFIYDDYNKLTKGQQEFVINDLLNRNYIEVEQGIFVEKNREQDLGKNNYEKEFMDCQILRQIGFDKIYMLPQQYVVRTNKQTGNNTDTFAFQNGDKFDFIELKNPKNPTLKNLQEAYQTSLKQAKNVFIVCNEVVNNKQYINAIKGRMKLLNDKAMKERNEEIDFSGNIFIYNEIKKEVVQVNIKKYAPDKTSRASLESSQNLSKWGSFQSFHFSLNKVSLDNIKVNKNKTNI